MSVPRDGGDPGSVTEPKNWPTAESDVAFDPARLRAAAELLKELADDIDAPFTALGTDGQVKAAHVGNWDAGQALATTAETAHTKITSVADAFRIELQAAIDLLHKSAGSYRDTATEADDRVRQIPHVQPPGDTPKAH